MTTDEAFAEMKRRGWGFARQVFRGEMIAIGPITNPDFKEKGEPPIIEAYAIGVDPVETLERAIQAENERERKRHAEH